MQPPTFREIIALLKHDGFVKVAQVGSHAKYVSGDRVVTVTALVVIDQRRARGQVFVAKLDGSWRQNEAAIYL